MSQINPAYDSNGLQPTPPQESQPAESLRRSPEQQAEFERLGKADTYYVLESDEEFFRWLDDQRDRKSCGYVIAPEGTGLHKVCRYYQMERVKQRRGKFLLPVSVIYAEIEQYGGPKDMYGAILTACSHPLAYVGPLKDRRDRTIDTLRKYGTKILILNHADYFALESLNELVDCAKKAPISIILVGTPYLEQLLGRNSFPYIRIHDSFLEVHEFPRLERQDVIEMIEDWEELFLGEQRLNLASDPEVVKFLHEKSGGLREALYEIVRQIATVKLDKPNLELSRTNLVKQLGKRKKPKVMVRKKAD